MKTNNHKKQLNNKSALELGKEFKKLDEMEAQQSRPSNYDEEISEEVFDFAEIMFLNGFNNLR